MSQLNRFRSLTKNIYLAMYWVKYISRSRVHNFPIRIISRDFASDEENGSEQFLIIPAMLR